MLWQNNHEQNVEDFGRADAKLHTRYFSNKYSRGNDIQTYKKKIKISEAQGKRKLQLQEWQLEISVADKCGK